jgi:hypothetical protein
MHWLSKIRSGNKNIKPKKKHPQETLQVAVISRWDG